MKSLMSGGNGSIVVGVGVLIVVILLIQLAIVRKGVGGKKRSVLCKAPEGLKCLT